MTTSIIDTKIAEITAKFDDLAKKRDQLTTELNQVNEELTRYQGEYRALVALKEEDVADPAATIDAEPKETKKNGK